MADRGTLLVDARAVDHPTAGQRGIGRYVTGLLQGFSDIAAPAVALVDSDEAARIVRQVASQIEIERLSRAAIRRYATDGSWFLATQLMLHPIALDPIPAAVTDARLPVAGIVYDVIPYRYPKLYLRRVQPRRQAALRAVLARTLDSVMAISAFAADTTAEELRLSREHITVIGAGVDPRFRPCASGRGRQPFVLTITGTDGRKNTDALVIAWTRLPPAVRQRFELVIAGSATPAQNARWSAADGVTVRQSVDDDELVRLMQSASLVVIPSLEEGFGLPVAEAAACGTPVVCSGVSSLPEILDEPRACFDPHDPSDIAAAIERALCDEDHRAALIAAAAAAAQRWRWPNVARVVMTGLAHADGSALPRPRPPGRRVAFAVPAGAAGDELAAAFSESSDGDVITLVDTSATTAPVGRSPARFPTLAAGTLVKVHDFDHIVALVDASPVTDANRRLAERNPCHVWLAAPDAVDGAPLEAARSVIVHDDETLAAYRDRWGEGHRVLVASMAGERSAAELARWLDDVDSLPMGTVRRSAAAGR